jgi:hypothetical protein
VRVHADLVEEIAAMFCESTPPRPGPGASAHANVPLGPALGVDTDVNNASQGEGCAPVDNGTWRQGGGSGIGAEPGAWAGCSAVPGAFFGSQGGVGIYSASAGCYSSGGGQAEADTDAGGATPYDPSAGRVASGGTQGYASNEARTSAAPAERSTHRSALASAAYVALQALGSSPPT